MLGNKDFANLLTSGVEEGKTRFDLKQIAKWDKEINQKKKGQIQIKLKPQRHQNDDENEETNQPEVKYRDRALERRNDKGNDDNGFAEVASKMDAEQTKFLGGDFEHTHLVKGLDYALLNKMRREEEKNKELKKEDSESDEEMKETHENKMSKSLRNFLFPETAGQSKPHPSKAILLTAYEFSLDQSPDVELPLIISKSAKEASKKDEYISYALNERLHSQLAALFENGVLVSKSKRKRDNAVATNINNSSIIKTIPTPAPIKKLSTDFDSIYDDDIPLGKYVPEGLLSSVMTTETMDEEQLQREYDKYEQSKNNNNNSSDKANKSFSIYDDDEINESSKIGSNNQSTGNSKTAHSGHHQEKQQHQQQSIDYNPFIGKMGSRAAISKPSSSEIFLDKTTGVGGSNNDNNNNNFSKLSENNELLKPVQALLNAQVKKEQAKVQREQLGYNSNNNDDNEMIVETDEKGKKLVNRDVFATTKDKVVEVQLNKKKGDVFGVHGSYDDGIFPESSNFDMYGSDDDDGDDDDGQPATKKQHTMKNTGGNDNDGESSSFQRHNVSSLKSIEGTSGIKKNLLKISTPWNKHNGDNNSSARNSNNNSSGDGKLNRAARRAMANN